ncbi:glycosyltransferase family 2 protein [Flavobacterium agrisoli]|uniref:Glycosyltransferase family 2 protein n=1 Tax=Flavobacterium agrisoli TaxID=2793066 RepID=A0A934PN30_9FLAO|nr:glycosyltransferase family 2 protein [Flavobacterium agrisoli]MBK0371246.1 glycosyltransferase family 2 protein [Flavobacterium agrisoli]
MLAIVIPYYKLTFFEKTLQSLAAQTDKRFKVYIGDDDSPENPKDLLVKYQGQFDFLYHRFENNLGRTSLTQQWERCIALSADEEWIMILGDDDYLCPTVVSSFYFCFNNFNIKSNLVRYASKLIDENQNKISFVFYHPVWESSTDSYYRKFKKESRSSLSEYIFSRKSYLKYGFYNYPLAWNSDDHAWLDFSDGKPIYTINNSIVFVRVSFLSVTGSRDNLYEKNLSEIQFYKFLISNKFICYDNTQRLELIKKYGKEIGRNRNLYFSEWIFILFNCFIFFNLGYVKKGFNMLVFKLESFWKKYPL